MYVCFSGSKCAFRIYCHSQHLSPHSPSHASWTSQSKQLRCWLVLTNSTDVCDMNDFDNKQKSFIRFEIITFILGALCIVGAGAFYMMVQRCWVHLAMYRMTTCVQTFRRCCDVSVQVHLFRGAVFADSNDFGWHSNGYVQWV